MERSIKVIIPETDNDHQYIRPDVLEDVVDTITREFGGVTVYPQAAGCWINRKGTMDCDRNMVMETTIMGSPQDVSDYMAWLDHYLKQLGVQLGQESLFEQVDRATATEFVPGRRIEKLPPDLINPNRPRANPSTVLREMLP